MFFAVPIAVALTILSSSASVLLLGLAAIGVPPIFGFLTFSSFSFITPTAFALLTVTSVSFIAPILVVFFTLIYTAIVTVIAVALFTLMALMLFTLIAFLLTCIRMYSVLPKKSSRRTLFKRKSRSLAVFLGSGGHTTEALLLISALDFSRYTPRTYIISEGDTLSARKATELESSIPDSTNKTYRILTIPRARRVHQSLLTTPPTALYSLLISIYHITLAPLLSRGGLKRCFADVLVLNGPGTCFVLCIAVYINKFLGLTSPKLIYVESFARVRSLSLSGKLLRPLVDRFLVQWPELLRDGRKGEYRGLLV